MLPKLTKRHLWHRVVVDVDDLVEVARHHLRDVVQSLEVERSVRTNVHWEGEGGEVAHGHLQGKERRSK